MKTQDTKYGSTENIIDATAKLKAACRPRLLKRLVLAKEEGKVIDLYIAARRREQAASAAAEALKPQVLRIVQGHQQIARRGALVSLDHSYRWHYSGAVTAMAKALSEEREQERENGTAKATVSATVAFEDVRRKERSRREAMERAG